MNHPSDVMSALHQWLLNEDYPSILELAKSRKRTLSWLTALTYDENHTVSERAITATGLAAKLIADRDLEYVRNYLLRLFWLLNDESGGIGWRAPELIGEILANCPNFEQFFPMLISLLDLDIEDARRFLPGTLWAIGRVAQARRDAMLPALSHLEPLILLEEDPEIIQKTARCIEQLEKGKPIKTEM